jgi:hypothetical protein
VEGRRRVDETVSMDQEANPFIRYISRAKDKFTNCLRTFILQTWYTWLSTGPLADEQSCRAHWVPMSLVVGSYR